MAMKCDDAFDRLLEADPQELTGRTDSDLAVHVRGCARCQVVASELLAGQVQLAGELAKLRPRPDVSEALRLTRARWRRTRRLERAWHWGPVAAAAVLAAAMVLSSLPAGRMVEGDIATVPTTLEPLVEEATSRNVLVFEARDRSAKVVWFY